MTAPLAQDDARRETGADPRAGSAARGFLHADDAGESAGPAPVATAPVTIQKRRDFLACAKARKAVVPGFVMQGRNRRDDAPMRVGYTCSKKVGNAVARNRAKRRLREIARMVVAAEGHAGWDYVLIGRPEATIARPFDQLLRDASKALQRLHAPREKNREKKR